MSARALGQLTLACVLGTTLAACGENHPLGGETANGANSANGRAGSTGAAGGGTAGGGAAAGAVGGAASAGTGGAQTTSAACDITPLVTKYFCTVAGACHDAFGSGGNFDMSSPGWEQRLVGVFPKGGGQVPSMCFDSNEPYLIAGSQPARGLFMDKFNQIPPCGIVMPQVGPTVSPVDLACFQTWANALTVR